MDKWIESKEGVLTVLKHGADVAMRYQNYRRFNVAVGEINRKAAGCAEVPMLSFTDWTMTIYMNQFYSTKK